MQKFLIVFFLLVEKPEIIVLGSGKVLLYKRYTYSLKGRNCEQRSKHYYCSKKISRNCRAKVTVDKLGYIKIAYVEHNHEPPILFKINNKYITCQQ